MGFPLLADVCKKHQLNFEHIANVNSDHFINQLKAKPDTVVLSMTSQLYKEKVLNQSLAKFYNFHPGLLPRNKGRFPIFWAFLNNDGVQGITCHEINQKIDDGRTVFQKKIIQRLDDDMGSVLNNLKDIAPSAFEEAIKRISKNDYQTDLIQAKSFYGPTPSFREILRYNLLIAKRKLRAISYRLSAKPLEETTNL
jgi:methionyl-tRNA formyltransferase